MDDRAGTASEQKEIILTHDIDLFPAYALQMARLERFHGIRSTYYILLHSEWYNALSPENIVIWKEIKSMGHEIGFHYDTRFERNEAEMIDSAQVLDNILDNTTLHVSQHLTTITEKVPLSNYFSDRWNFQDHRYIADSSGRWRDGCICQWIGKEKLVINCHPVWWVAGSLETLMLDATYELKKAKDKWEMMINEYAVQNAVRSA